MNEALANWWLRRLGYTFEERPSGKLQCVQLLEKKGSFSSGSEFPKP